MEDDFVDWNDVKSVKARIRSAKADITRKCTAIDKLSERQWTFDSPTACKEARIKLNSAYELCTKLHDRWSDLATLREGESDSGREDDPATTTKKNQCRNGPLIP